MTAENTSNHQQESKGQSKDQNKKASETNQNTQKAEGHKETIITDLTIKSILDYEQKRYKRKGFGILFAATTAFLYFYYFPKLLYWLWPKGAIEHEGLFYFLATFLTHEAVFLFCNFYFTIIHTLNWDFFERYKVSSDPWPWQSDPTAWRIQLSKTIKQLLFNHLIVLPLLMLPNIIFNVCPYRLEPELPSYWELIPQLIFCMLCEDFAFYWSHRLLHSDKLYAKIHKMHHEFKQTCCIGSEYAHPIEYVFGNILTTSLGGMLLGKRMHFISYLVSLVMMVHETHDGHCGYEFSWSPHRLLPLSIGAEFHIFHHLKFKGNYASLFTFWDRVGNTVNKAYLEYYQAKEKKD
jgi:methylsterol monooxygenase/4-alpha-methyl-delta7-sterol-4alpha-methyl oxidase